MRTTMDIKILSLMLVLGIPAIGLYLFSLANSTGDNTMLYIALFLVFMFPIIIRVNVLRSKTT